MKWRQGKEGSRANSSGQTLVELTIAMSLATLLMAGLSSALLISSLAFDGHSKANTRSRAAEVQADMVTDLQLATGFTTKTATSVAFTVPDRDGDTNEETITYNWDSGNATLDYIYNGSPAETLLNDVTSFDLSYLSRSLIGTFPTPPPLDSNSWGSRWDSGFSIFGYDTLFGSSAKDRRSQVATLATLPEAGTVHNIFVYLDVPGGGSLITAAIYDVDGSGDPDNLLVAAANVMVFADGWHSLSVTPTNLPAGDYYLAVGYDDKNVKHYYSSSSGSIEVGRFNNPINGWASNWGNPSSSSTGRISIYANYVPD